MGMNVVRSVSAVGVGAASAAIDKFQPAPLVLGTSRISYGALVEALALVGGSVLQFMMPYTAPSVADGLVDGSLALLAKRGTTQVLAMVDPPAAGALAQRATRVGGYFNPGRTAPLMGNLNGVNRVKIV